jgi:citrate lyase subunit beta/citryl-CoA lyase
MTTRSEPFGGAPIRSILFSPGDKPHMLERALAASADVVVADLEDAVADSEKGRARLNVAEWLAGHGERQDGARPRLAVRINAAETPHARADLEMTRSTHPDLILLPKAMVEDVRELNADAPGAIAAIIETPAGVQRSAEIARSPIVAVLILGQIDLANSLRLHSRPDGLELTYARSRLVVDSAAAGLLAPLDGAYPRFTDEDGLLREATIARDLGFGGKVCIHPAQVAPVNGVFAPTATELNWARRVVDAAEAGALQGKGTVALDGEMIDRPVLMRARALLSAE